MTAPTVDTHAHFAPQRAIVAADRGDAWHGITFSRGADGKFVSAVGDKKAPLAWEVPFETAKERLASLDTRKIDIQMVSLTPTMYWHELDGANGKSLARDAFVFIHPANVRANPFLGQYYLRNFVGNPLETTVAAASMIFGGVIDRLPRLKVGLSHAGGYAALAIGRMDHGHHVRPEAKKAAALPSDLLKHFYIDSIAHSELALRHVIDEIGIDRVVLGSDYPADMGEPYPVDFVEKCSNLTAEEKRLICSGNIQNIIAAKHFDAWQKGEKQKQ